jgi:hypothetical protein
LGFRNHKLLCIYNIRNLLSWTCRVKAKGRGRETETEKERERGFKRRRSAVQQ